MTNIRIGKNVIETLTSGMYEDARFVYREYVQNSADQIDRAVELGILQNRQEGEIHIIIDYENREIVFEDNATGIQSEKVYSVLGNIALSEKDRTKNKGFRGIGRLGGLGYCDELIFETSYFEEDTKTVMVWDAKSLQSQLNDSQLDMDAATLVESVININKIKAEKDKHYFKITLKNVNNEGLLNYRLIEEYLSMVAPVPFPSHFIFKHKIYEEVDKIGLNIDEYHIFLNTNQLFKSYSNAIYDKYQKTNKIKIDEIFDIDFIRITDDNNELIAWGWFGLSQFIKQIPNYVDFNINPARGLRLRKGNIQIGSEKALDKLHKEPRGNFYFIGEIYAIHSQLIPNSRRDYFKENSTCEIFNKKLKNIFYTKLYNLYYNANTIKNAIKKINYAYKLKDEIDEKILKKGFTDKNDQQRTQNKLEKSIKEAKRSEKKLRNFEEKIKSDQILKKVFDKYIEKDEIKIDLTDIDNQDNKIIYRTNKLSKLTKKEQKFLSKIFSIIDIVLTPELAENLKNRIEEEFK